MPKREVWITDNSVICKINLEHQIPKNQIIIPISYAIAIQITKNQLL